MMAAFIVAIRGTLKQAVLLGLAATLSHTAVVWIIAMAGLWFGRGWDANTSEPWFQLISGVMIVAIALWMAWRTWKESQPHDHHHHDHTTTITMTMTTIMIITIIRTSTG
jgi:nickel/cobalt exporter